jgi:hypothetical protein
MSWHGSWINQYGSVVEITSEDDGRIEGFFRTALKRQRILREGRAADRHAPRQRISFASIGTGPAGDMIISYTGLLREGKMETL